MDNSTPQSRLTTELSLLDSMYPSQCSYDAGSRDFTFKHNQDSTLVLRLPSTYPESSQPELISARIAGQDCRGDMQHNIVALDLEEDVECLDAILGTFVETVDESTSESKNTAETSKEMKEPETTSDHLTIIIWLHHLLATSKRKAAVSPSLRVSGVTKPGYPGVMLFSGSATAVREHVTNLKGMKWQAFQIRYEEAEEWDLTAKGEVIEVEKLSEVVDTVTEPKQKEIFLDIMKIR